MEKKYLFVVKDLTKRLPDERFETKQAAHRYVSHLWEWHPHSRPVVEDLPKDDASVQG